jgi:hypothetical protein
VQGQRNLAYNYLYYYYLMSQDAALNKVRHGCKQHLQFMSFILLSYVQEWDTQRITAQEGAQRTKYNTCARASEGPIYTYVTAATTKSSSFSLDYAF